MVLLWRADADSMVGPSRLVFDIMQAGDVARLFFVYENVMMRGKADEDNAGELLRYLQGNAFEFFYDT